MNIIAAVQLRDLRLLDPHLATSYPSAILARDNALVLNLEFVKAVVTRDCVLILNPGELMDTLNAIPPQNLAQVQSTAFSDVYFEEVHDCWR